MSIKYVKIGSPSNQLRVTWIWIRTYCIDDRW